jgi:hypothetical protein
MYQSSSTPRINIIGTKRLSVHRYSLGVALWTSADYLLDEEEEPALSADFWYGQFERG